MGKLDSSADREDPLEKKRPEPLHFIQKIVKKDTESGLVPKVVTRFPPEPNGFLHIGHAKAIVLNADIASEFGGDFLLRMDDTNPQNEEECFVQAICRDVEWLGIRWKGSLRFASDYFDEFFAFSVFLIERGLAYVDELSSAEVNAYRGSPMEAGLDSPYRNRPAAESLERFDGMRRGLHPEGSHTLRAKIDMGHENVHMRDPVLYRIKFCPHPRQGEDWPIFPMYDFAHPLEDAVEGITHSLCSIEFENHRPVYDWVIERYGEYRRSLELPLTPPRQYEFARLNMSYTTMSKRILRELIQIGAVAGWDDPRLPTLSGMRRRGFPPEVIVRFVRAVGVTKVPSMVGLDLLYHYVREWLNERAERWFAVIRPLKVVISNYPEGKQERFLLDNGELPGRPRELLFTRELWIEREDFLEDPPRKYFRLALGREVRLKNAYCIVCEEVVKDEAGEVTEIRCRYDPDSRGPAPRKVKGTIHWLSVQNALPAEFRLYGNLFTRENMNDLEEGKSYGDYINPDSLEICSGYVEPALELKAAQTVQFLRLGYFTADSEDHTAEKPVFNRCVALKDSWAKQAPRL